MKSKSEDIGNRIKENYENITRMFIPRRTYTIIRLDGRAFHKFTKKFKKPYDLDFMRMMDETAIELCKQIQGAKCAFVQSDEINIVVTDFDELKTNAWFDGNIQKIASISASIATSAFNKSYLEHVIENETIDCSIKSMDLEHVSFAHFDSRVFSISDYNEVINVFVWRQIDATKNAIQMLGRAHFSHKELHGLSGQEIQYKLMTEKSINFNDQPIGFRRGRLIKQMKFMKQVGNECEVARTKWESTEPDIFSKNKKELTDIIPLLNGYVQDKDN